MSLTVEQIAAVAHEANRRYCIALGDTSQKLWDEAPEWQKKSAIQGVLYRLSNPEAPASAQHEAWLRDKEKDGWVFGEKKDEKLKTHPCILDYSELPEGQKAKDALFIGVVKALAPLAEKSKGAVA